MKKVLALDLHEVVFVFSYKKFLRAAYSFFMKNPWDNLILAHPRLLYRVYQIYTTQTQTAEHVYDTVSQEYQGLKKSKQEFLDLCNSYELDVAMHQFIKELKAEGWHIAVCSNIGEQAYADFSKQYADFFGLCDVIVVSEKADNYRRKPHHDVFKKFIQKCTDTHGTVDYILFIDDKKDNVKEAQAAGIHEAHQFKNVNTLKKFIKKI